MASTLTAAGIKLCLALMNHDPAFVPTADVCSLKFLNAGPYSDRWMRSPRQAPSCPDKDGEKDFCQPKGFRCIVVETYEIYDGSKGSSRICFRDAVLRWTVDGLWYWDLSEIK